MGGVLDALTRPDVKPIVWCFGFSAARLCFVRYYRAERAGVLVVLTFD